MQYCALPDTTSALVHLRGRWRQIFMKDFFSLSPELITDSELEWKLLWFFQY